MSNIARPQRPTTSPGAEPLAGPHFRLEVPPTDAPLHRSSSTATQPASVGKLPLLRATGLRKSYRKGNVSIPVLNGVDIQLADQEFLSIVGKSGSGKSTLLHVLATLDAPDAGEIHFDQGRIDHLSAVRRDRIRNQQLGIVFQFYHLLPELTTLENVLLPAMISLSAWSYWVRRAATRRHAAELLERVGLGHRLRHRPRELSGGEMQRVAIARALMNSPRILLADEPTGNLDRQTGGEIMQLLRSLNHDQKLTIVMVTHDAALARQSDRVVQLVEGRVSQIA
jgi:lipoprotein-releasing system ATP-binding protein